MVTLVFYKGLSGNQGIVASSERKISDKQTAIYRQWPASNETPVNSNHWKYIVKWSHNTQNLKSHGSSVSSCCLVIVSVLMAKICNNIDFLAINTNSSKSRVSCKHIPVKGNNLKVTSQHVHYIYLQPHWLLTHYFPLFFLSLRSVGETSPFSLESIYIHVGMEECHPQLNLTFQRKKQRKMTWSQ